MTSLIEEALQNTERTLDELNAASFKELSVEERVKVLDELEDKLAEAYISLGQALVSNS